MRSSVPYIHEARLPYLIGYDMLLMCTHTYGPLDLTPQRLRCLIFTVAALRLTCLIFTVAALRRYDLATFQGALVGHPPRRALMPLEALAVYHTLLLVPTSAQPYSYAVLISIYIYIWCLSLL